MPQKLHFGNFPVFFFQIFKFPAKIFSGCYNQVIPKEGVILKIRITNLAVNLSDDRSLEEIAAEKLKISPKKICGLKIVRKAIDARRRNGAGIKFTYIADIEISGKIKIGHNPNIKEIFEERPENVFRRAILPESLKNSPPVVVGFGPAGMFAALTLAKAGFNPIILERGGDIDSRTAAVKNFFAGGELDENSNVQFGEGGAGTFSDGKLTTRIDDDLTREILEIFVKAGAPEEILYLQKPHIGTDRLREVVKNIRREIISLGGKIHFDSQVTDIEIDSEGKIFGVIVNDSEKIPAREVFFGIGHSARDTYEMLNRRGVTMEIKPFAIGVRIEHPQEFINRAQFGEDFKNPKLPAADYMLTFRDDSTGRGAYSFCMCPGGVVVAATSEKNRVVTNGMSNFARNSGIANSALLVTVTAADFKNFGNDVLSGMRFQRHFESLAFETAGKNYFAPVQSAGDFLSGKFGSGDFAVNPTYPRNFKPADLHKCLPAEVSRTLENALKFWDDKIKNFAAPDIPLTGIETRTSAPCRILRNRENFQSVNIPGLFPIGEGAGYAGGIMSSAVDGMKAALYFLECSGGLCKWLPKK